MKIISVSGSIGSGKDTVAEFLVNEHGYKQASFADTLKDAVSVIFGWDREMLAGKTKAAREQRELVDPWWAKRLGIPELSPRWMLQRFGTEVCRNNVHNDIWIASLENTLRKNTDNIVISDARFMNELTSLKSLKATMVRVSRGDDPIWWERAKIAYKDQISRDILEELGIHQSEWDWARYEFDKVIYNNGTLDELYQEVSKIA